MKQMKIAIKTISPVVLTATGGATVLTETHDVISGSILRGVLADQYIKAKAQELGDNAHENDTFCRLFFGAIRFVDATPSFVWDGVECRSFRLPFSLQKEKSKGEALPQIMDLVWKDDFPKNMKSFQGYAVMKDGWLQTVEPQKDISLHMSRASDKERRMGRSNDGGVYSYESLEAGQTFSGLMIGEEDDLRTLCNAIPKEMDCRIGRSKFAQYGHCHLTFGPIADVDELSAENLCKEKNAIILRLDTHCLLETPADILTTAERALTAVAEQMNAGTENGEFSISHVHAAAAEIDNYVGVWGMKRPRETALAAGTVFALVKNGEWTARDYTALSTLMYKGVGRRTEEGFGQLRLWPEPKGVYEKPKREAHEEKAAAIAAIPKASEAVAKSARKIFTRRLRERLRIYAVEDVERIPAERLTGLTHFFGRLDQMLVSVGDKAGIREAYRQILEKSIREQSRMDNNMHKVATHGRTLHELLREKRDLPYEGRDWKADLGGKAETTIACMKVIGLEEAVLDWKDGTYFYEYWHWFFRFARKKASTKRRKEAEAHE